MKKTFFLLAMIFYGIHIEAQPLELRQSNSKMQILGTSSIHDWESNVEEFSVKAELRDKRIRAINFTAIVRSIKSGKSAMDKNTFNALKESKFPVITFSTDELLIEGSKLYGEGQLTVAGKTNKIPINLTYNDALDISVSGSIKIRMTEYDIIPPTAVFGTIKTGDEVTVKFNFMLTKN